MTTLILIDRDGVINHDSPDYVKAPEEWEPIPGSLEAIAALQRAGCTVAVCSNQAGVGRGLIRPEALAAIHDKMEDCLATFGARLDALVFCPHHPDAGCRCRKPKPGMLLDMMARFQMSPEHTWYVGDSVKDADAACAAACRFALVRTGNGREAELALAMRPGLTVHDDLASFASWFIGNSPCRHD
jgi:D-glycero-D-manno-heptose 1,7-bisphosphate phosphatase